MGKYKKGKRISFEVPGSAFAEMQEICKHLDLPLSDTAEMASLFLWGVLTTMQLDQAYGLLHGMRENEEFCKHVIITASRAIKEGVSFSCSIDPDLDPELLN